MSLLEPILIAALIIYFLFLLAIFIEYITDKRKKAWKEPEPSQEIPEPGPAATEPEKEPGQDEPPKAWKEEEFE